MNKSVIVATLFLGVLFSVSKVEAAVKDTNAFKSFQTAQNSPWDPREEESSQDDTAKEDLQHNQTEE